MRLDSTYNQYILLEISKCLKCINTLSLDTQHQVFLINLWYVYTLVAFILLTVKSGREAFQYKVTLT